MVLLLVAVAIVVTGAIAGVLFEPVELTVVVAKTADAARPVIDVRLQWFVWSRDAGRAKGDRASERTARPVRTRRTGRFGWRSARAMIKTTGFVRRCRRLLRDIGRLALPDDLRVRARVGFADPADTGMLLGWLYAWPMPSGRWDVVIEPDFTESVAAGVAEARWRRSAAGLLRPVLAFLLSPVVWQAARAGWRERVR